MINRNGWTGGAVVWLVFFVAILGENWIVENSEMETVTGFEISEMGAAVLPAAIEDQETIVFAMKNRAIMQRENVEKVRRQNGAVSEALENIARQADIEHWQALRVLSLLKHLHQYSGQHVADADYPPVPEAVG